MRLPERIELPIPAWLRAEAERMPATLDPEEAVAEAVRLARRNVAEGTGGPFGSVVLDDATGAPVALGVNLVTSVGMSSLHTEVVALSLAQVALGTWHLSAGGRRLRIAINAQPCAMCLGAVLWSGVVAVDFALEAAEVERLTGFDEGPIAADWVEQFAARGIVVTGGVQREAAVAQFLEFQSLVASGEAVVYNAER